ncbi:hypothetical protein GTW09_10525 [Alteromonas hispanica]|uniref:Uncharacterized protein n=2 Tax=Alteromonas TaxID=226 RepID=A0A7X5LR73_9ALTE|nr:hypothetical protein [Alteromonas profundi]NDW21957.1 hypothetical protein [Alteromonas hispanica]
MGHNGEAAPRVCVPANAVSVLIGLLCTLLKLPFTWYSVIIAIHFCIWAVF